MRPVPKPEKLEASAMSELGAIKLKVAQTREAVSTTFSLSVDQRLLGAPADSKTLGAGGSATS